MYALQHPETILVSAEDKAKPITFKALRLAKSEKETRDVKERLTNGREDFVVKQVQDILAKDPNASVVIIYGM